jgi:serine/threonine protein kinase
MPWDDNRFQMIRKLQDARRNRGQVNLMRDLEFGELRAVKVMPNSWVRDNHAEFVRAHPQETELPWQDIGCMQFLSSAGYSYSCTIYGIYRDQDHTYVVTSFATEGDLFSWIEAGMEASPKREKIVTPVCLQILCAVQQLHDIGIAHRDLSLENILVTVDGQNEERIKLIDFGMSSTKKKSQGGPIGKSSYQAPELHTGDQCDGFLCDVFSLGVAIYAMHVQDYPWVSTRPGQCKCFMYVEEHGFRAFVAQRKIRNSQLTVGDCLSEGLQQLLEGMLAFDPAKRLTLGERSWKGSRRSVWDEPYLQGGSNNR